MFDDKTTSYDFNLHFAPIPDNIPDINSFCSVIAQPYDDGFTQTDINIVLCSAKVFHEVLCHLPQYSRKQAIDYITLPELKPAMNPQTMQVTDSSNSVQNVSNMISKFPFPVVQCDEGHVIHSFLVRDRREKCNMNSAQFLMNSEDKSRTGTGRDSSVKENSYKEDKKKYNVKVSMFLCQKEGLNIQVPYTVLCDFRSDCPDNSDEYFCQYFAQATLRGFCYPNSLSCGQSKQVNSSFHV